MRLDGRPAMAARALGVATLVGVGSLVAVGLSKPLPDPQLMANIDNSCLQFSQDGGQIWGDVSEVTLDESFTPVPGGEYLQGDFLARNRCAATASLQVYAGAWQVSDGGSGLWRADLDGVAGAPVELTGPSTEEDWGVLINEVAAPHNQSIPVKLYLGIPAGETIQNYSINPAWSLSLEQTEPATVPDAPSGLQAQPGSPTTDDRVTVTGTAEPGSTVNVTVDGQVRCTTTASIEDGTFSCDVGTLSRGTHQISATATNSVGTSSPASPNTVTVRNAGPSGWGSLDDLFNWGSLGGLGSLGSLGSSGSGSGSDSGSGSGVGSEAGSTTGSIAAGSLGTLGSAAASSGGSKAGSGTPGADDPQAGGPGTGGTGGGANTGTGAGSSAPGAGGGTSAGSGNAATTGPGQGGGGAPGTAGGSPTGTGAGTSGGAGAKQGATGGGQGVTPGTGGAGTPETGGTGQSGTGGGAAGGGNTGGGAAGGGNSGGGNSGGNAGGQSPGTAPGGATGGQAGSGATGQLSADSLGVGSSAPGQSASRPLGSVEGLLQLGSSSVRVGQS